MGKAASQSDQQLETTNFNPKVQASHRPPGPPDDPAVLEQSFKLSFLYSDSTHAGRIRGHFSSSRFQVGKHLAGCGHGFVTPAARASGMETRNAKVSLCCQKVRPISLREPCGVENLDKSSVGPASTVHNVRRILAER
jgi:hypothetical protein